MFVVEKTYLKGKYKGTMSMAACFNNNEQIFPLAFDVVDLKNEASYA